MKEEKIDEIIVLLKSIKALKDIELTKQDEKLAKFKNVEVLLGIIIFSFCCCTIFNENIKELIKLIRNLNWKDRQMLSRIALRPIFKQDTSKYLKIF